MTLTAGARLGPYEVLAPIGAGGMGEVWRARDPRLGREVAVKVLPAAFTDDPERLARFQREAQLLAALNHPHIAAIYGVEEAAGAQALVLELVEGETLAEKLASGPIDPAEALEIARQIAEALEAAHEKGIVHRDLKPANVKLTPSGKVKVLDFGLAKALAGESSSPEMSHSPTITGVATREGVIIGTAAYMSPEQARGKPVDKRTDIWAFGVVLYEMLAGREAFHGETVSDTLAAILTKDPDWSRLPARTPPGIRRLLARCLEKDRNRRLHDIADARIETEEGLAELRGATSSFAAGRGRLTRRSRKLFAAAAGLILAAGGFFAGRLFPARAPRSASPSGPIRSIVPLPEGTYLAGWASPAVAISRDGRRLAFVAVKERAFQQLYVHRLDTGETRLVPDSETAEGPFFSPDGEWVAFATDVSSMRGKAGALKKYSLSTGLTQQICAVEDYFGGSWGEDGTIALTIEETRGIWTVPSGGGTPAPAASSVRSGGKDESRGILWPQHLAAKRLLVTDENASRWGNARILDLATRELTDVHSGTPMARYAASGHLLLVDSEGTLFALPFDPGAGRTTGSPVATVKDVAITGNAAGAFAVSDSGTLVYATGYVRGSGREAAQLVRLDRQGNVQPLPFEAQPFGRVVRISPDGRKLAAITWDYTIWVYDLVRNSRIRLPNETVRPSDFPAWTADGERIAFSGDTVGTAGMKIFWQKADGSEPAQVLNDQSSKEKVPDSFTPDGASLLYGAFGEQGGVWLQRLGQKAPAQRIIPSPVRTESAISPDGKWLLYTSSETGNLEVYLRRFPELDHLQQVSAGGGYAPLWSRDGREIFYRGAKGGFFSVPFEGGGEGSFGTPRLLFEKAGIRGYDVAPDGKGFYAVYQPPESGIVRELHLVTNWFEELNRLAPAGKN
ncbi:MAG TPA: protein kinase [Thermoanaerobaculia bacterium]|nr:protein kinase [Thermoanaerobaculia bacterium]